MSGVRISSADDPVSCRAVEELQREVWGQPDRAVVPAEQIRAVVHNGGMLLLAHEDDTLIGFCYAFVGVEEDRPIWCSHMLAVRRPWRSKGVGRALKQGQRALARERGISKITWTFDPLQARNAYLNLHRLGAYARRYFVDHYGAMDDDINRGTPTDRLLAEWPVADAARPARPGARPWILPATTGAGVTRPGELDAGHAAGDGGLIAVPSDVDALRRAATDATAQWRLALRDALQASFAAGLTAVDVERDAGPGIAAYVLARTA